MKSRFFLVAILVAGLILILVGGVDAQSISTNTGTVSKSQSILENVNYPGDYIFTINDFNIFLPLIFNNYSHTCSIAPALISPSDGSNIESLVPTLTFETYNEDATYSTIKVDDNDSFDSPITYGTGGFTGEHTLMLFHNLEPATTYYWYAYQTCDTTKSPDSPVFSFTTGSNGVILPAPTLLSPSDGSSGIDNQTIFSWEPVSDAIEYQLWLCIDYGPCFIQFTSLTSTQAYGLDPDTEYYWYVVARNDYAYGDQSAIWEFSTDSFTSSFVEENKLKLEGSYVLFQSIEGPIYKSK